MTNNQTHVRQWYRCVCSFAPCEIFLGQPIFFERFTHSGSIRSGVKTLTDGAEAEGDADGEV